MSIADKLTRVAENVPRVYYSGYERGYGDGYVEGEEDGFGAGWWDVETAVTSVLESPFNKVKEYINDLHSIQSDSISTIRYIDDNIPNVYENGRNDWWLKFQQLRELRGYQYAFRNNTWTDDIYEPVMPINAVSGQNHNEMFRNTWITDTKVPIYFRQSGSTLVFSGTSLQTIHLLDVIESVTYVNWFANCTSLENITMSGVIGNDIDFQYSPLNKDSIISIIGCLSSTASGKTLTLKESAVIDAFGSLSSQEWLDLINTKSNWEISTI